jgi:serine/threonine-protein kinase
MGDTLSSPPHPEQPFPGYRVVRELGRGGMGVVYLAQRLADDKPVALKTIKPAGDAGDEAVQRFLREADVLRQLDHPNVVAFRELGQAGGRLFFVMDYVEGRDAAALLREAGPWPVARAVGVVGQLLDALQYAHDRGFVHRDVKPHNLLLAQEGGREAARLADFGLARVYQASRLSGLTMTGQIGGTMAFMAPEQITSFRESRPPVDQYAAAATLYNLLSGRLTHDFPSSSQERLLMILQAAPVPLGARRPDLPPGLAEVVHRALAKEPAARYASAAAFRQALAPFDG